MLSRLFLRHRDGAIASTGREPEKPHGAFGNRSSERRREVDSSNCELKAIERMHIHSVYRLSSFELQDHVLQRWHVRWNCFGRRRSCLRHVEVEAWHSTGQMIAHPVFVLVPQTITFNIKSPAPPTPPPRHQRTFSRWRSFQFKQTHIQRDMIS
jgi:hypothetical protein